MIINNFGDGQITNDNLVWNGPRTIQYAVTSADNQKVSGTIAPNSFLAIPTNGKPPYTVEAGYQNFSYTASAQGVPADAVLTFYNVFPTGTNYTNGPTLVQTAPSTATSSAS